MKRAELPQILAQHKRVAIVGGPRTGKSTLAATVNDRPVMCTDDTQDQPWSEQPAIWLERAKQDAFVIEGVQVARTLRKGLQVDAVIVLPDPLTTLSKGQWAMTKGHKKILAEALALNPGVPVYRVEME